MLRILPGSPNYIGYNTNYMSSDYKFIYNNTTLLLTKSHNFIIDGNVTEAALAVFYYMLEEYRHWSVQKIVGIYVNGYEIYGLNLNWDREFLISYEPYIGMPVPEDFIKLQTEFNRIKRLMVFI